MSFYQDLEKRWQEAKARQAEVQARFNKIQLELNSATQETNALVILMQKEKERGGHEPLKPLADFICEKLAIRTWEKAELQAEAEKRGYFADHKGKPGRIFHLTFINLLKTKRIMHVGGEQYGATKTVQPNHPAVYQHGGNA